MHPIIPVIKPNPVLGILGGGQLGRMIISNGAGLGFRPLVWDEKPNTPAMQLSQQNLVAPFADPSALKNFLQQVDSVAIEWENIPVALVKEIAAQKPVVVPPHLLATAQARHLEKQFFAQGPVPPVPYVFLPADGRTTKTISDAIDNIPSEAKGHIPTVANITFPAILKTDRLGYDGIGQWAVDNKEQVGAIVLSPQHQQTDFVLEQKIKLMAEGSVLVARDFDGHTVCYPMVENKHEGGILRHTSLPARNIPEHLQAQAIAASRTMADQLSLQGVLCIEFFIAKDATGAIKLLANEMAPRPHNSYHWTIEGTTTSQFAQLARIALGFKVAPPLLTATELTMNNILGNDIEQYRQLGNEDDSFLHLYGKAESRPGRKMGHYTVIKKRC